MKANFKLTYGTMILSLAICLIATIIYSGCEDIGNDDDDYCIDSGAMLGYSVPNGAAYDDMFFEDYRTNPFIDTEDENLSTFGMDVDTASYSITRRYINDGYLPPPEAVRVEEFVNVFDYGYSPPINDTFALHIEAAPSKFGDGQRMKLLRIGIKGRVVLDEDRKDAILTFVIDVSGSMMMENRLELVKRSLTLLVEQLRPGDKVGIVIYGSRASVVLPHTGVEASGEILAAINALESEGSTFAEEGIRMGYDLALRNSRFGAINRVILCSDGVANVGKTGSDEILNEIRAHVEEGITLSTVGFGMGNYNDVLMEQLADNGNGNYAYVDTINEARRVFVENLTGTLQIIAKDAKIQVDFNSEVASRFRLIGYENRWLDNDEFRDDKADGGEIGSGHNVTALYEVKLHENATGRLATIYIRYEDPDTHRISEFSQDVSTLELKDSFESASNEFQLAAGIAEFAEILRESYWAKGSSLEDAYEVISGASVPNDQVDELEELVRAAMRNQDRN